MQAVGHIEKSLFKEDPLWWVEEEKQGEEDHDE